MTGDSHGIFNPKELNQECLQFAGNVLVYGGISPCDGDWFGGITQYNAEQFLDRLVNMEVGEQYNLYPTDLSYCRTDLRYVCTRSANKLGPDYASYPVNLHQPMRPAAWKKECQRIQWSM